MLKYPLEAGGKRLRPILTCLACELFNGDYKKALIPAVSLELIHTYSLVHDDLPAMDNDDLRRGKPTTHVKYGEANAILVGDGLLTHSFEILSNADVNDKTLRKLLYEITESSSPDHSIDENVVWNVMFSEVVQVTTLSLFMIPKYPVSTMIMEDII